MRHLENAVCHFVFYTGPRKGEAEAFNTARISIGRSSSCDFRLEAFQLEQVGTHHAEVLLEEGNVYYLYDLGTKSGTFVNGERVHERCTLMTEDYLRFGQDGPEVIFRIGPPMSGKQPLPQIVPVTAELEFFSGSDAGRIFPVNATVVSNIGRRADLEIPLDPRGDMIVSGNHCNIRYINGHFVLSDSSRNGTYVNGDLVDQPMEILEGDVIMLGDGGPQARFHVDEAKRHYPNHRPLSPVSRAEKSPEPAESAFKRKGALTGAAGSASASAAAAAAKPLASAKPFSTGGTALPGQPAPPPVEPQTEEISEPAPAPSGPVTANSDITAESEGHGSEFDAETVAASSELDAAAVAQLEDGAPNETASSGTQGRKKFGFPAATPTLHGLKFKPGKKIIFAAIALVVVIGLIAVLTSRDDDKAGSARGNYGNALEDLVSLSSSAGGFKVAVPEGWTNLSQDNYISTESADKNIAVDYVRDPALNEAQVREILGRNGAQVEPEAEERTVEGMKVKTLSATAGNVRRIATLHQATAGAPAMALLETTEETLDKLDKSTLDKLLVENLEMTGPGPTPPATPAALTPAAVAPTSVAAVDQGLPTPSAATPSPKASTPSPAESPVATAAPTPAPSAASTDTTSTGNAVVSKALKLSVVPPETWTGFSEEEDAMLTLSDGKGLEIRIARDPGELDAKLTFDAMKDEGWVEDGRKTDNPAYKAGEFHQEDQNLMLVLIPEKQKTTIVIYATSEKDFVDSQRYGIIDIINQLVPKQ